MIDKYDNVATAALHLTDNGPYNDTLAAINDGNRSDNGYSDSRWSTWDKKDDSTHEDAVITMDWATAIATNQINLFYFYQPNDHAPVSYTHLDVYKRQAAVFMYVCRREIDCDSFRTKLDSAVANCCHNPILCFFYFR